jgi:hypothetical protein
VLNAAAARIGQSTEPPQAAAIADQLKAQGVDWAWQLHYLNDGDWAKLDISLGLRTATKAELIDPTDEASLETSLGDSVHEKIPEEMQTFLFISDETGSSAKSLRAWEAFFYSLLTNPVDDRQGLILKLFELIALIGGLFLTVPLSFRRPEYALGFQDATPGWRLFGDGPWDGMDALMTLVFVVDIWATFTAVMCACNIAAIGSRANYAICLGSLRMLSTIWISFWWGVIIPVLYLMVPWHVITDSKNVYPVAGALFVAHAVASHQVHRLTKFWIEHMPLEAYHLPYWLRFLVLPFFCPWIIPSLRESVLLPAAEARAATLRQRIGVTNFRASKAPVHKKSCSRRV